MAVFKTTILTLEEAAFEDKVDSLVVPGLNGRFGVLAGHAPLVAALQAGILKIGKGLETIYFVTGDGMINISHEGVLILAEAAIKCSGDFDAEEKLEAYIRASSPVPV